MPRRDTVIPANAPALFANGLTWTIFKNLELLPTSDAGALPATTFQGGGMYSPWATLLLNAPLIPGETYVLRSTAECGYTPGVSGVTETTIVAGEARPLPTSLGTARVEYQRGKLGEPSTATSGGVWVSDIDVEIAQITIEPSPELIPYLPLTNISTRVDGQPWGGNGTGNGVASREPLPGVVSTRDFTRIHVACGPIRVDSCMPDGTTNGHHEIEIGASIVGSAAAIAPIKLSVHLACPGADGGPDAPVGDGGPDATPRDDAPNTIPDGGPAPEPDANDTPDVVDHADSAPTADAPGRGGETGGSAGSAGGGGTNDVPTDQDGCSVSHRAPERAGMGALVFGAAALSWTARRRKRA